MERKEKQKREDGRPRTGLFALPAAAKRRLPGSDGNAERMRWRMRRVCPVQLHISRLQGRRGVSSRSRPKWARSIHSQHASFAQGADRLRMLPSCSGLSVTECGGESEDGVLRRNELEESQATSCVPLRCGAGCRVSLQLSPEAQECRTTWHQNTTLPRTDIRRHIDARIHCSSTVATSHLSRLQDWHVYLIRSCRYFSISRRRHSLFLTDSQEHLQSPNMTAR